LESKAKKKEKENLAVKGKDWVTERTGAISPRRAKERGRPKISEKKRRKKGVWGGK